MSATQFLGRLSRSRSIPIEVVAIAFTVGMFALWARLKRETDEQYFLRMFPEGRITRYANGSWDSRL